MKINYSTPCATNRLQEIRSFVQQQLTSTNLSEHDKHQVVLAIDEACANAIIHGNHCDNSRELKVEMSINPNEISIEIYDIGTYRPNEINNWQSRNVSDNIRDKRKGGMGLRLIHYVMDNVRYYNKGQVNVCSLIKRI